VKGIPARSLPVTVGVVRASHKKLAYTAVENLTSSSWKLGSAAGRTGFEARPPRSVHTRGEPVKDDILVPHASGGLEHVPLYQNVLKFLDRLRLDGR
jgi:hypothetical protein